MRLKDKESRRTPCRPLPLVLITIAAAFLLSAVDTAAGEEPFSVNYPPGNVVMEYNILGVSMNIDIGRADIVKAFVNKWEEERFVPDLDTECFSLPLVPGVNMIEIEVLRKSKVVWRKELKVFLRSDITSEFKDPPEGFRKAFFHMEGAAGCDECHKLDPVEYDMKPISPKSFAAQNFKKEKVFAATSTCYSCHNKITSKLYVHGPAAVWSCLSCHEKDSEPLYAVRKPDAGLCFKCHTEQKEDWDSKKFIHGPVNIGKCTICHSPHSANNPFNLFKPTWDLCTTCHFKKGSGKHVLGDSFSTKGHPTRNKKDPVRKGKELSCASCHEPHASNFPHLWAFNVQSLFELCRKCHYDK